MPKIGDIHWAWTRNEWIGCKIYRFTDSGKSFYCYNAEKQYGSFRAIPIKDFRPEPKHPEPQKF
ncbi:hypothetical protein GCM10027347_44310 [Larkinella harenae]